MKNEQSGLKDQLRIRDEQMIEGQTKLNTLRYQCEELVNQVEKKEQEQKWLTQKDHEEKEQSQVRFPYTQTVWDEVRK